MVRTLEQTVRLRNARVLDLRTGIVGPPQDLCVLAGRIVRAHGRAPIIDVEERLVMPGLWDNHVHFATWARSRHVGPDGDPLSDAGAAAAALGVVGIVDVERDDAPDLAWAAHYDEGFRWFKTRVACYPDALDGVIGRGLSTGTLIRELVKMGPLKIIADGTMTSRTAHTTFPYPDEPDHPHGVLHADPATLTELLTRADVAGMQGAVHAIGDAAVTVAMDAYERSGAGGRIEHVQLIAPDQITRMARLGLSASVQPCHLLDDRDTAERLWAGHTGDDFPFASLADAGVPLFFGSDAPVSPLDPWAAIEAAVTRTSGGREPWHPEQRLTVSQALAASTGGVSALVPGAAADLIVLETSPFDVQPTELSTLRPWLTMCYGQVTHQR